jgi:hypothetical protein
VLLAAVVLLSQWRDCSGRQGFFFFFLSLLCFFSFLLLFSLLSSLFSLSSLLLFSCCLFFLSSPVFSSFFYSVILLLFLSSSLFFSVLSLLFFVLLLSHFSPEFIGEKGTPTPLPSHWSRSRVAEAAPVQPPLYHPRGTSLPLILTRGFVQVEGSLVGIFLGPQGKRRR